MKTEEEKLVPIAAKVPPEIKSRLVEIAEKERRPLSNLLRCILEDWLKAHGTQGSEGKQGHK